LGAAEAEIDLEVDLPGSQIVAVGEVGGGGAVVGSEEDRDQAHRGTGDHQVDDFVVAGVVAAVVVVVAAVPLQAS
jgi:hypothetical protein